MKHTMKMIGASICCILCLAVIGLFVYVVSITPEALEPEQYQISANSFLNLFYRYLTSGIDFNLFIMIVGLIALLIEIVVSSPLKFLFSQLPLGRILQTEKEMTIKKRIIPSLLIGIAAAVDTTYATISPDSFAEKAVWINWAFLIVIAISFLVQFSALLSQGGIWRVLVSGCLLVIANLGCGALLGMIVSTLCILVTGLAMGFGMILFGILVFFILAASSS